MYLIRPATSADLEGFYVLAMRSSLGLTSLPKDRHLLAQMLALSEKSFDEEIREPGHQHYIFCLENAAEKKIVGCSMINARSPSSHPLPYFIRYPEKNFDLVHLSFETEGISELCGLYITSDVRGAHLGKLLSIGRLMFIADHLKRFTTKIFADIRGVIDEHGNCPFWNAIMRPFFKMSFHEGVEFYIKHKDAFNKMIPSFPIYFDLLPPEVRAEIGIVHQKSVHALNLLEHEGFVQTGLIHPLDGGPRVEAFKANILTIKQSDVAKIHTISSINAPLHLISTSGKPFKATLGPYQCGTIDEETAKLLDVQVGDLCRTIPLH